MSWWHNGSATGAKKIGYGTTWVIQVKDSHRKATAKNGYDVAIVITDMTATAAEIIARYPSRGSNEVCFHDGKNISGVGETQNRVEKAVNGASL